VLAHIGNEKRPHWHKEKTNEKGSHWYKEETAHKSDTRQSCSALGLLEDMESAGEWVDRVLDRYRPVRAEDTYHAFLEVAQFFVSKLSPFDKARFERVRQDTFSRLNRDIATISRATPGTMTRCQAHENARGVWQAAIDETCSSRDHFVLYAYFQCKESPECWDVFCSELCHLYCTLVRQTTPVSVVLGGDIGLHQTKSKIATVFGPGGQHFEGSRWGSFFNNLMRLISEARQEHPADGGDLAFVPREHPVKMDVDNIRWTHQTPSDHFSDGTPIQETVDDLFAGRLDPLCAEFLALDVVEIDAYVFCIRNRRLTALKFFQQRLRDNGYSHKVSAVVHKLSLNNVSVFKKFIESFSTTTWGESVDLRRSSKTVVRAS